MARFENRRLDECQVQAAEVKDGKMTALGAQKMGWPVGHRVKYVLNGTSKRTTDVWDTKTNAWLTGVVLSTDDVAGDHHIEPV